MGADIKNLRTRIKSVTSTLHLTNAMGLVASSKIRRASLKMKQGREYASAVNSIVSLLSCCTECKKSVYLQERGERTCMVIIAGDRGMAGGYNANVFRLAKNYPDAEFIPLGKRACDKFGKSPVSSEKISFEEIYALADRLCKEYKEGKFDKLSVLHTKYVSMLTQEASVTSLLPLTPTENADASGVIFEPNETEILENCMPEYVAGILFSCVQESFASEVAARKAAMDSAGKNATEMLDNLQVAYNRARQGAITQEITEIVAGSGD